VPDVFVDTAAWIAILDRDDDLNSAAQKVMQDLERQQAKLITTEFVLLEVADGFAAPATRATVARFISNLRSSISQVKIIPISSKLFDRGLSLYQQRLDKGWELADRTSFVVMDDNQISQAFTSDRHFEQAGFTKLL
jgi:uncharacterized protein